MSNTVSTQSPTAGGEDAKGLGQRRVLLVVGGAALLLVLGLGAYFLFLSGGEDEDLGPVPSGAAAAAPGDKDPKGGGSEGGGSEGGGSGPDEATVQVDNAFAVGRDPFAPLPAEAVEQAPDVSAGDDPATDPSGTGNGGGTGNGTGAGTPDPTNPSPTPSPQPTTDVTTSYKVTVQSVNGAQNSAVIEVNGKRFVVKVKGLFTNTQTGPFRLTRVGELPSGKDTATVVFGSDAPVELVAKDTVVFKTQ